MSEHFSLPPPPPAAAAASAASWFCCCWRCCCCFLVLCSSLCLARLVIPPSNGAEKHARAPPRLASPHPVLPPHPRPLALTITKRVDYSWPGADVGLRLVGECCLFYRRSLLAFSPAPRWAAAGEAAQGMDITSPPPPPPPSLPASLVEPTLRSARLGRRLEAKCAKMLPHHPPHGVPYNQLHCLKKEMYSN